MIDHSELPELPPEFDGLPVFVVGGWVRDKIRGVDSEDIDLMVAEVSPNKMRERGFREIDLPNNETFGVFQDSLGREVAIGREEVSTGPEHTDFDIQPISKHISAERAVEEDLKRRDFAINAIAVDARSGELFDPHNGVDDLDAHRIKQVRAVDETAFVQDPLRILRGARFAARLENGVIEPDTRGLMEEMVGKLHSLPEERIRLEMEKALVQADEPSEFFEHLEVIGALEVAFPEIASLRGVPAGPEKFHKEGDAMDHTLQVVDEMSGLRPKDEIALLMALAHDLGKAETPQEGWPHHFGHGRAGVPVIDRMATRLSMSNEQRRAMRDAARHHMRLKHIDEMRAATVFDIWNETRFDERLVDLMVADARGRIPQGEFPKVLARKRFGRVREAMTDVTGQSLIEDGLDPSEIGGEKFGKLLRDRRIERMHELRNS